MRRLVRAWCVSVPLISLGYTQVSQATLILPSGHGIEAVFTVQAENGRAIVRVITRAATCPVMELEGRPAPHAMAVRASPAVVAKRGDSGQAENKEAVFDVLTCEAELPPGTASARVEGWNVPLPRAEVKRIVIVGDTGCRMKQSENAFQSCNDTAKWPFEQISRLAANLRPDLVIHLGDLHYRESPCPATITGCAGSPWGYGFDAWAADLFRPARPLLGAAPWVFVRGNHESCFRAGRGWFRFVAPQAWSPVRSCDDPNIDEEADYSDPYSVPISLDTQLIVFDSSRAGGKPYPTQSRAYQRYSSQMLRVGQLARQTPHSIFLNHHPVLGFTPSGNGGAAPFRPGNAGLQSVMQVLFPDRMFPAEIDVAMHGHVHLFESISFASGHPATLVMGNSGSAMDKALPETIPPGAQPAPGAVVADFSTISEFGFATLDRDGSDWLLTEWNAKGEPVLRCIVHGVQSRCRSEAIEP